ncbi:Protein-tyrosine phosphatase [Ancylostoma caninum]|uniref:Protein-tyrosine phosphatase n=1 Tax=Ancylostoma caninum TaxID=29170 RepID=A0A368F7D0_ANCCA|nr:Protein-tyrosine phosphatase [Ancylostoma caninum]
MWVDRKIMSCKYCSIATQEEQEFEGIETLKSAHFRSPAPAKYTKGHAKQKGLQQHSFDDNKREEKNAVPPASVKFSLMAAPRSSVDPPFRKRLPRAAKRAQVKVFVEETLKKGVRGLVAEFKSMKRMNDFTKMTEFLAQTQQGRNRYKDVGCLDNDRVILKIGPVSYIHANYVSTPMSPKRFICTQAPLPKTCPEFWYMVVQEKSTAILMLCNFVEQKAKKCAEYFPTQEGPPLLFDGNVSVQLKKQEPVSAA